MPSAPHAVKREVKGREEGALFLGSYSVMYVTAQGQKDKVLARTLPLSLKTFLLCSGEIEAVKVHHFGPGPQEVLDKLLL